MVYNLSTCSSAEPWFDTVTGRCRNDTVDPVADAIDDLEEKDGEHDSSIADLEARVTALEAPGRGAKTQPKFPI